MSREERGLIISQRFRIKKTDKGYVVPSRSGSGNYLVKVDATSEQCDCPDYELRKNKCKHIFVVEYILRGEVDHEGNVTVTKEVRVTYPQDWKAYNTAQCNEHHLFMELLHDLRHNVEQPTYSFGRPSFPLSDMIFSSALKVYSTFSLRRFTGMMHHSTRKKLY